MARQRTNGAPGWRELRRHRIERERQGWGREDGYDDDDEYEDRAPRGRQRRTNTRRRGAPTRRGLLRYDRVPVALVGFLLLSLWWAVGGRYTIDGTPLLINEVLNFFHMKARLGVIVDPLWYLKLCWVPILISWIERRNRPRLRMDWSVTIVYAVGIWLIVSGADLGSTWLAVTHPDPNAWPLARQIAQIPLLAALWTVATTFAPEIGFAALWKYMRG